MSTIGKRPIPFVASWWCRNPHLQTLWPTLLRWRPNLPYRREVLDLPDGDFIDLDWLNPESSQSIVVLVHGLCGSSHSTYMLGIATRLAAIGHTVLSMNLRGASGRANRRPRTYHSGQTGDLDFLLETLAARFPERAIHCAGFSLGGNLLLKWLGENPGTNRVRRAVAVSVPYLLDASAARMNSGVSKGYQAYLLNKLKRSIRDRSELLQGRYYKHSALTAHNFETFDSALTAPVNDYADAARYYALCSSRQYLPSITVPTLLIHARDDPFMTPDVIPQPHELGPNTILEVYPNGGHVGFVEGPVPGLARYWLESRIPAFLAG